jgi:hypothetical protein
MLFEKATVAPAAVAFLCLLKKHGGRECNQLTIERKSIFLYVIK